MIVLSGRPPRSLITAIVSRQPSPSVVAAMAQPSESRIISLTFSTTSVGRSPNLSVAANSARASVGEPAMAAFHQRLVAVVHHEFRPFNDRPRRRKKRLEESGHV